MTSRERKAELIEAAMVGLQRYANTAQTSIELSYPDKNSIQIKERVRPSEQRAGVPVRYFTLKISENF